MNETKSPYMKETPRGDLISREELLKKAEKASIMEYSANRINVSTTDVVTAENIKNAPAQELREPRGTYQCFHCGSYSVVWGADFDFSDYGYEGEGIIHSCHCANCGAEIEYRIAMEDEESIGGEEGEKKEAGNVDSN